MASPSTSPGPHLALGTPGVCASGEWNFVLVVSAVWCPVTAALLLQDMTQQQVLSV